MTRIISNSGLNDTATSEQTGTVGEPSLATSGKRMMVTGNWYASRSTDRGASWQFVDPFTEFPAVPSQLCCDQVVHYSRSHRIWVWLLQYSAVDGENVFRIAVSRSSAPGTWTWWDIAPVDVDSTWTNQWFDYPDVAESDGRLWVSFNMFDRSDRWQRAAVLTFTLDELADRRELTHRTWSSTEVGSVRFVHGADDTMWFAAHDSLNTAIRLFAWSDDETTVSNWTVPIRPWNEIGYTSRGPGGAEWLARVDGRITAGWRAGGRLGFAWTASPEDGRPHPFVRSVRINEESLALIDEPDLWSANGAYAYPAACPNQRGDVGITAFFGGPTHPAHVVGHLDDAEGTWRMTTATTSTHGPNQGKWGDYITCRPDPRRRTYWIASGYTLQGGTDRRNVQPHVVTFAP